MSWLSDCVFSIRDAAIVNLKKLAEVFGSDWARRHIVPAVLDLCTNTNYLYRMTAIFSIKALAPVVNKDVLPLVLPAVVTAAKDPVPNCRFNASKCLQVLAPLVDPNTHRTQVCSGRVPCG